MLKSIFRILKSNKYFKDSLMVFLILAFVLSFVSISVPKASAADGVPEIISYQGRLYDSSGDLLGGSGTNYYFRFSIWDAASSGSKLWPAGTPSTMTYQVRYGVFNAGIGDTGAGGDALTLDFNDDAYYLQVEVASLSNFSDGETLTPRQQVTSSGYAKNADTVDGWHASSTPSANQAVVLNSSGNLEFGTTAPTIQAQNGLTLQTTVSGDINLSPAGGVRIVSATTTQLHIGYDSSNYFDIQVASDGGVTLDATGTDPEFIVSDNFTIEGQLFVSGTATSTVAGDVNFDSGTFFVDSINDRVGIGTSTPDASLDITGTAPAIQFTDTNNDDWLIVAEDDDFEIKEGVFGFSPSTRLVIQDNTGYIGIGTTTPATKLQILDTSEQLRLNYDADSYASFTVDNAGDLTMAAQGGEIIIDASSNLSLTSANDLLFGSTALGESTSRTDSGAYVVGVNPDNITNSASTSLQFVLEDLDSAIDDAVAGGVTSVTAGDGLGQDTTTGGLTVWANPGTGITTSSDEIAIDTTANLSWSGTHTFSNTVTANGTLTANGAVNLGNGADNLTLNAGSGTFSLQSSGIDISTAGDITNATWSGTAIDFGTYTNATASNGLTISGDNIQPATDYSMVLTASSTNWNTFYDTPSTRITAGTGLSWSSNTLNVIGGSGSNWTYDTTYGESALTPSSTIPIWAKDTIYASSTLIVDGHSTLGNVSSTLVTATTFYGNLQGNVTGDLTGNASTASALAANGANCASGNAPLGVDASGAVESCFDVWTEAENTAAGYVADGCSDCLNATEIEDIYVFNTSDTMSGTLGVEGTSFTLGTDGVNANRTQTIWAENGYEANLKFMETPVYGMGIRYNATDNILYWDRYLNSSTPTGSNMAYRSDGMTVFEGNTLVVDVPDSRVGINDSTPDYGLDVNGTLRVVGAGTFDSTLGVTGDLTVGDDLFVDVSTGEVGIGVADPLARLHVNYPASGDVIFQAGTNDGGGRMKIKYGYNGYGWYYDYRGDWSGDNNEWQLWSEGAGTTDMQVYGIKQSGIINFKKNVYIDGNVGIGTTTPTSRLTLQGSGATSATYGLNVADSNGTSNFVVRDDGNVGIGTTSPITLLTVGSSTPSQIASAEQYRSTYVSGQLEVDGSTYLDGNAYLTDSTNLYLDSDTTLGESTSRTDSGAYVIGVNPDNITNSASTSLQFVLEDLDTAIADAVAGGVTSVTAGDGLGQDSTTGGLTVWAKPGAGITTSSDVIAIDTTANLSWSGTHTFSNTVTANGTFDANGVITLGDGGDTFELQSTGIDITTGGVVSNATWNGTAVDFGTYTNATASGGLEISGDNIQPATNYSMVLTASSTNWNTFYDTPSTRITAGTGLSWSSNTLNVIGGSGSNWTYDTTYGESVITPSSTIPIWAKDTIYASSTLIVDGNATLADATSTSLYTTTLGINSEYFTDLTGSGLQNSAGVLTVTTAAQSKWTDAGTYLQPTNSEFIDVSYYIATSTTDTSIFAGQVNVNATTTLDTDLVVDTNTLFVDSFNDRVGIGTTTPFATLAVQGTTVGTKTVLFKGYTSQIANIFEIQNSGGSELLSIDPNGLSTFSVSTSTAGFIVNQTGTGDIAVFQASSSAIFTIGQTQVTSEVPLAVNASGDTGLAGNLIFTNPTATYIKSDAPLYIQAGDLASNEDLTLSANNEGWVIIDDNLYVTASSTTVIAKFNNTGDVNAGNILELEDDGTDVFTVDATGDVTLTQTFTVSGTSTLATSTVPNADALVFIDSDTTLGESTSRTDSGAYKVGVNPDNISNSASTSLQFVLEDLDSAIDDAVAGGVTSVTAGDGLGQDTTTGGLTVWAKPGAGITTSSDVIAIDTTANLSWSGTHTFSNTVTANGTLTANGAVNLGNGADNLTLNAGSGTFSLQSSGIDISTAGDITNATWSGTAIDFGTYTNATASNGLTISGDNIQPATDYSMVLTASSTNWNTFYDTPSNRITAGTGLSWSSNTLNVIGGSGSNWTYDTTYGESVITPSTTLAVWVKDDLYASSTMFVDATTTLATDLVVDTNTLFVDSFNDRVGIGTASPSYTLDVQGGIARIGNAGTMNWMDGDGDLYVEDELEVDGPALFSGSGTGVQLNTDMQVYSGESVIFGGSETARVTWNTAQTNNALLLTVDVGSSSQSGNIIIIEDSDRGTNFGHAVSTNPTLYIQSADAGSTSDYLKFWHDQTNGNIDVGSGDLNMAVGGSNIMTLASGGNVGIATTSPLQTLALQGTAGTAMLNIASSTGASVLYINEYDRVGIGTMTPDASLEVNQADAEIRATGSNYGALQVRDSGATSGRQSFDIRSNSNVLSISSMNDDFSSYVNQNILNIGYGGEVGIGDLYADANLEVVGDFMVSSLAQNDGDRFIVNSSGNVGIGTTTPDELLTIEGVTSFRETTAPTQSANYGKIYVKSSDSKLYFMDDSGSETDLTAGGGGGSLDTAYNTDSGERTITVDDGTVSWDLTSTNNFVVDIQGTGNFQVQDAGTVRFQVADAGVTTLTANSSSDALTINQQSTGDILVLENNGTEVFVFNDSNQLRVYDSAGTDYLQLAHNGSNAAITTNAGNVEIGTSGNDVYIGAVGSASNLVFEESSTISGQGANTITMGVNGDTIDLGVSGVTYKVRNLVATGTNLTIDVNNTATTTVVFENQTNDEVVQLAVEGSIAVGTTSTAAYTKFGDGTPGQSAISTSSDVYIAGDIEVDGVAYLSGGTAWTQGDFAEEMSVFEFEAAPGDVVVVNSKYTDNESEKLFMARLSFEGNSNQILGIISTAPAGILKYDQFGDHGQPVVLTGTAPVKVTTENGEIKRGELLTTSATIPGAAMRAVDEAAGTLGIALEDYVGDQEIGYVSVLLNINNNIQLEVDEQETSTSTSTSTDDVIDEDDDGQITVINNTNNTQIVVIEYEELANIEVRGSAVFTGSIQVVDAEFTGRVLVKGDIIIDGDIDLSGAITSWFWLSTDSHGLGTDFHGLELGDAVAVVDDNTVQTTWANDYDFRPAVGIAVGIKSFTSLSEEDIANMPKSLKDLYDSHRLLADNSGLNSTSTPTSSDAIIPIENDDEFYEQFKMVKVAISGVVKGYENLIPGNRYFLSLNDEISRAKELENMEDQELADLIGETDDLIDQADDLSQGAVAGAEEITDEAIVKISRTITYQEAQEDGAHVQVIGIAKSTTELLIQPSFNYSINQQGYLAVDYSDIFSSSTATTTILIEEPEDEEPIAQVEYVYIPVVEDDDNNEADIDDQIGTSTATSTTDARLPSPDGSVYGGQVIIEDDTSTSTEAIVEQDDLGEGDGDTSEVNSDQSNDQGVIDLQGGVNDTEISNSEINTEEVTDIDTLQPTGNDLQGGEGV